MTELSPEARRLLGLARRGDDPFASDRLRNQSEFTRRFAAAAGFAAAGAGTSKAAGAASVSGLLGKGLVSSKAAGAASVSGLLGKGLVTGFLIATATVGTWSAAKHFIDGGNKVADLSPARARIGAKSSSASERASFRVEEADIAPPTSAMAVETGPLSSAPPPLDKAADMGPLTSAPPPLDNAAEAGPKTSARPLLDKAMETGSQASARPLLDVVAPRRSPLAQKGFATGDDDSGALDMADPLRAEVAALRDAQQAMTAGDPARTLVLLEEQGSRFTSGALGQERAAAKIFALCALHRAAEASALALAFEQRWPKSPLLSRVRRACDTTTSRQRE